MAFTTQSMNPAPKKEEAPTGEFRKDAEGRGYWHNFSKDEKPKPVEEPKVAEEPKVEEAKPVRRRK